MTRPADVGADLLTLAERVWTPVDDPSWPVAVWFGRPPGGACVAEEYVVVPDMRRPRFLVPVGARRASRAAFGRYLTTSSWRTRALGYASAAGFGSPLGEHVVGSRLTVTIDPGVPRHEWPRWLLLSHLAEKLETPQLVAYLPVRRAIPNAKPTLRLFDTRGTPLGYVKVGWSDATREVVRNEAAALRAVDGELRILQTPALAASGTWHDHEYAVAAPLPPSVKPWLREPSTTPELLLDIARSGRVTRGPLAGSGFAARVRADLDGAGSVEPGPSAVLRDWLDRLEERRDDLDFGRWHGDFVPWNLGRAEGRPVAWDWEYSDPDVPVGFDLVHWHFQHRLSPADATLVAAAEVADAEQHRLTQVGVAPSSTDLVTSLYLLEVCVRAVRMAAAGAGWNPKLYPALLDLARDRASRPGPRG